MNLKQVTEKIKNKEHEVHSYQKSKVRLEIIQHELDILRTDLKKSYEQLKKEKADVEDLENRNIKSLFTEILGDIEQQLEKERQEYLQAVLHHNHLIDEIKILEFEAKTLRQKQSSDIIKVEGELVSLYNYKAKLLKKYPDAKKQLEKFDVPLSAYNRKLYHIEETISEAKSLHQTLKSIVNHMKNVKKWGPAKMHGKGRYSSFKKKTFIDNANQQAIQANVKIKKFDKELKDVYPDMNISLSMHYFENFVDHFYDNLITDWMIQRKLDNAIHSITLMVDKMSRIQMMLEKSAEVVKRDMHLENEKKKCFIKSFKRS